MSTHALSVQTYEQINELLTKTFATILRVEEKSISLHDMDALTISELHTIDAIGLEGDVPMKQIASSLGITMATATVAISKLVDKGYAARFRPENDRRKVLVSLTKKGKLARCAHEKFHKQMIDEALSGLTSEEIGILADALVKIKNFFESQETQLEGT
ncbi:MarR family transcriptional regulator [Eggerthellaceae bacterium 3-80]